MKKILGILLMTLLISTSILPMVSSENMGFDNHVIKKLFFDEESGCDNSKIDSEYVQDKFFNHPGINVLPEYLLPSDMSCKHTIVDTPEYFNWMDYEGQDWTTSAKNQLWPKVCGSCWDFAAISALESIINIREGCATLDPDLSEQYVLSCLRLAGSCKGGSAYEAFRFIMKNTSGGNYHNGIIPESCFPYRAIDPNGCDMFDCYYDPVLCDEKCENWEELLIPISDYGLWVPDGSSEDIEAIKTQVMETGPVVTSMTITNYVYGENNFLDWGYEYQNSDDYYPYPGPIENPNHQVIIVGWKDDPSIGKGGYWICKNSWGEEWGYDGFFNIEYGSLNIDDCQIHWVDYDPKNFSHWAPVADADGPYSGNVEQELTFDASGSFDHEGNIVSYEWNFGDGHSESGMTITHSYNTKGIYPVKLTVIDNEDNMLNDSTWAFIDESNNPPNKPKINGPTYGNNETVYEYTFSASDIDGDNVYYYIVWGDWNVEEWIGPIASDKEITLNHTWINEAKYTIRAKAKDIHGEESDWTTLRISMPKNIPYFNTLILNFLENHPIIYKFIERFLKL